MGSCSLCLLCAYIAVCFDTISTAKCRLLIANYHFSLLVSKRNLIVTGIIIVLVLAQFISTLIYYIKCYHFTEFSELLTIFTLTRVINSTTALADASIALVLVYLLQSSRSGFNRSDTIINRLIAFAINTGLITGVCAIISLITGLTLPNTLVYIMFYVTLSRCKLFVRHLDYFRH